MPGRQFTGRHIPQFWQLAGIFTLKAAGYLAFPLIGSGSACAIQYLL
ncbi:MAG: hypothetical protein AB2792_12185 [Candidatus Thiodiazotropha sp.]